jgi:hypothetical protein
MYSLDGSATPGCGPDSGKVHSLAAARPKLLARLLCALCELLSGGCAVFVCAQMCRLKAAVRFGLLCCAEIPNTAPYSFTLLLLCKQMFLFYCIILSFLVGPLAF